MRGASDIAAVLGGAFDPPHAGHVFLARAALADFAAREVCVIPNGDPRHREVCAPWADRVAMCELAFAGVAGVKIRRDESPGAARYSVDTLRKMKAESAATIVFIVGADAFAGLEGWREWRGLFSLTHFAVAPRKNSPPLSPRLAKFCDGRFRKDAKDLQGGAGMILKWNVCAPEVSSTELRARLSEVADEVSDEVARDVPRDVLEYARERALYRR